MELLIDIGNTSLKWTLGRPGAQGALEPMRSLRHHGHMPIDLIAAWETLPRPARVRAACVAGPTLAQSLAKVCRAFWGLEPEFVQPRSHSAGLVIAYEDPLRLGVDRWLALLAGHHLSQGPVLILDAGTAITFDLLLTGGRHLGGLILPGIETMRQGLLANTQIPRVEPQESAAWWARDTATAIAVGSLDAPAALAERLLRQLAQEAGVEPILLLTGGDAERLQSRVQAPSRLIPDLVLQGLALVPD